MIVSDVSFRGYSDFSAGDVAVTIGMNPIVQRYIQGADCNSSPDEELMVLKDYRGVGKKIGLGLLKMCA
jgi:hypothetical protein